MPIELSPAAAAAAIAPDSDQVWLACVTISGPGLETYRIVNNTEAVVRALGEYLPWPFEADLPEDAPRAPGTATLRLENIDPAITRVLREYDDVPQASIELVLSGSPDVVERGPYELAVVGADYDETVIELHLGQDEDPLNQQVGGYTYTPTNSPGLWP